MLRAGFLGLLLSTVAVASSTYTVAVIQIPTGYVNVTMSGINNSGQVTGNGNSPGPNSQPFIASPTGSAVIPVPPGLAYAWVEGLNNAGKVVGYALNGSNSIIQAFIGTSSGTTVIPLPSGWTAAYALAVSDSGQVTGNGNSGVTNQAFIGTVSGIVPIPLLSGFGEGFGYAINASGQVVGAAADLGIPDVPFIGTSSGSTALPIPMKWTYVVAYSINSTSQIVGFGANAQGNSQVYLGSVANSVAIPLPIGATSAEVNKGALNDSGVVVGSSYVGNQNLGGWIWDASDGTVLLNALVPVGWNVTDAVSISNTGLILAQASYNGGASQYVELSPSGCVFSLNPPSISFGTSAGTSSLTVVTTNVCGWQAVSNASWITITGGLSGAGNGTVSFNIDANAGAPRVGTLTVAGQTFTVNQAGAPPAAPTLVSPANGATAVSLTPLLTWSASSLATSYDIYFGTSATPPLVTNVSVTNYNPGPLIAGQTYYWQIVARNASGTGASLVWSFTTMSVATAGISPAAGSGLAQIFTFTFTDAAGFADLSVLDVLISTFLDGQTACYFALAPTSATSGYIYLVDDAGDGGYAGPPMPLPSASVVQNSQCAINATGSSVSANGNTLTLTLAITFKAGFGGNKAVYLAARSNTQNSGWQALGTWDVPGTPTGPAVGTVSPARSTSLGQTYTFTFTDSNGYADLFVLDVLTNSFLVGNNACYFAYVPTTPTNGYLYLVDDAGDGGYAPGSPIALSSGGTLQNSQCILNTTGSSASASGNTLTLNLAITFTSGFVGNRVFYLAARNNTTGNSGWQAAGSVTVP
jgi:Putative binding domain, N-terminal